MRTRRRNPGKWQLGGLMPVVILLLLAGGCGGPPEVSLPPTPTDVHRATATPAPTPTSPPPASLIVCLAREPESLYLYGDIDRSADLVLAALYDGPIDLLDFEYTSVLLEKTPALEDGDARVRRVPIASGDVYLNPESLTPERLRTGMPYLPPGCESLECAQAYEGGEVQLPQMSVEFRLREGLRWSDGEPLSASDSVFSFEIDGHIDTPTPKYLFARTRSYRATDERTVEWVGIPGFLDAEYAGNFATPLPEHVLGSLSPAELLTAPEAAASPIGWGPYQLDEWARGSHLRMVPNPHYGRTDEAPPAFESLVFRFLENEADDALQQVRTGECDVVDQRLIPLDEFAQAQAAADRGELTLVGTLGSVVERIDFNLQPAAAAGGPSLVAARTTRRAMVSCIDRDGLVEELLGEFGAVPTTFMPPQHPEQHPAIPPIPYDREAGRELLEEAGWQASEEQGQPRIASGVEGIVDGTPLSLRLNSLANPTAERVADWVAEGWRACGVEVEVEPLSTAELFAAWGEGPVFSREFQAVIWAWPVIASPPCEMFGGWQIPSADLPLGINATGFQDEVYDRACRSILLNPPNSTAYRQSVAELQEQFAELTPAIPLFVRPKWAAVAPWLCGVAPNASTTTVLWNVEELHPCP